MVVIQPFLMPNFSCSTLANGARQFVVHEALEMMLMVLRVVLVLVDAEHDREVRLLGRRGDDDLLRAGLEVLGRGVAVGEDAGRLEHDVYAERPSTATAPDPSPRAPGTRRRRR